MAAIVTVNDRGFPIGEGEKRIKKLSAVTSICKACKRRLTSRACVSRVRTVNAKTAASAILFAVHRTCDGGMLSYSGRKTGKRFGFCW